MEPTRLEPYEQFLRAASLQEWTECLDKYRTGTAELGPSTGRKLREGLCIAVYVRWLSSLCGHNALNARTGDWFEQLSAKARTTGEDGPRESALTRAVIAAGKGYTSAARRALLALEQPAPVEIALLTVASKPAARARELIPYVNQPAEHVFLPALYFHAAALLDLGYLVEVEAFMAAHERHNANALMIDLRGKLLEIAGSWREAQLVYRGSDWAAHRYRSIVCGIVAGDPSATVDELAAAEREKFAAGMLTFEAEADRAEVARSSSFINACRWNDFDSWLMSYELGRLCFQRRKHAEAERHFKVAAERSPAAFRFAVQSLRFTNLSWLNGDSAGRNERLLPEVLECARAALAAEADEEEKTHIRTFLGGVTRNWQVVTPVLDSTDDYERGLANQQRAETPAAIECWCACIRKLYRPRAYHELIKTFASFGFQRTALALAQVAMQESWDDFFQLWELGNVLCALLGSPSSKRLEQEPLEEQIKVAGDRLLQLAESSFQDVVRAYSFFLQCRRPNEARQLLEKADRLAESPEEHLQLAFLRRKRAKGGWDPIGLEHLVAAERESRDRLERLQVARELASYGRLTQAQTILRTEGALSVQPNLTHFEYVVALECGRPCLSAEEVERLGKAAHQALDHDRSAGLLSWPVDRFLARLQNLVEIILPSALDADEKDANEPDEASIWGGLQAELNQAKQARQSDQERELLRRQIAELGAIPGSGFACHSLWGWVFNQFEASVADIESRRPEVSDLETPIRRSRPAERARATLLTERWRRHLLASDPGARETALAEVQGFFEEEARLDENWVRRRSATVHADSIRLGYLGACASELLATICQAEEVGGHWPPFLDIADAVAADTRSLTAQLSQRIAAFGGRQHGEDV